MADPTDEALWREKLCRRLGVNPVAGPILDNKEARDASHALLEVLANPSAYDDEATWQKELERVGEVVRQHQRRVEDAHAARLGLPPRRR